MSYSTWNYSNWST